MMESRFMIRHKNMLVPVVALLATLVAGLIYKDTLTAWFSGAPVGNQEGSALSAKGGAINIAVSLDPDPPKQGDNMLVIVLADTHSKPLSGAELAVDVWMPAMGSMSEMRTKGKVRAAGPGRYEAAFDLAMAGSWNVDVSVTTEDGDLKAEYTLNVGHSGLTQVNVSGSAAGEGDQAVAKLTHRYAAPALDALRSALDAYETLRTKLAVDDGAGLGTSTSTIAEAMVAAKAADPGAPADLVAHFNGAVKGAQAVATAGDLDTARERFADLSKAVIALVSADQRLASERHVFMCPMKKGFNQWVQPSKPLGNPYKGRQMLTCGSELDWQEVGDEGEAKAPAHTHDPDEIAYYTCPMDSWVKTSEMGTCPVCNMDLQPVTKEQVRTGILVIDHRRRQLIGVRTGLVRKQRVQATIRAIGEVTYDESRLADVTVKYRGWVKKLRVSRSGQKIKKGQTLFTVYSPEVYAAQQEYLMALAQQRAASTETAKQMADALLVGARERLRLWDVTSGQLRQIAARGKPMQYLPVNSPATGYVVEKNIVEGGAFQAGQRLFRIANLDKVWIEAELYEQDMPLIQVGQTASVTLSHVPGKTFEGVVSFIYPYLDRSSRTVRARIELPNRNLALKPDMFADVELKVDRGEQLLVPESAVIYSGPRRIVFLDLGQDRFRPQVVEVGLKNDGFFEVLSGVREGDKVVISGNFLLSSESRLKSATGLW